MLTVGLGARGDLFARHDNLVSDLREPLRFLRRVSACFGVVFVSLESFVGLKHALDFGIDVHNGRLSGGDSIDFLRLLNLLGFLS